MVSLAFSYFILKGLESNIHFEFFFTFLCIIRYFEKHSKVENDFKLVHFIDLKCFRCLTYFEL